MDVMGCRGTKHAATRPALRPTRQPRRRRWSRSTPLVRSHGEGSFQCTLGSRSSRPRRNAIRGMRCSALGSPVAPRRSASTARAPTIIGSVLDRRSYTTGADQVSMRSLIRSVPQSPAYPYPHEYRAWPGPNSNTFTAYITRHVPELGLDLPSNAVGKDFLPEGALFATAPSGSGFQISLYGLARILLAVDEGFELNVLA